MGIRKYKPTTPGRRGSSVADFGIRNKSWLRFELWFTCPAEPVFVTWPCMKIGSGVAAPTAGGFGAWYTRGGFVRI